MTKQKLLELCNKLIRKEITKERIIKLKELTDEEIDIALNSKNKDAIIDLMTNKNFKMLSPEIKQKIIDIVNECEDIFGKAVHIINIATNKNAIYSNQVVELATIISKAKGINQSYKASLVACNFNAIASGQVVELVKILSQCEHEEQLEIAYHAAINLYITISGQVTRVVKLICEAKDKQEALKIYYEVLNVSKDVNMRSALSEGKTNAIDFWQTFYETGEDAISLLDDFRLDEEISSEMVITKETSKNAKTK